MSEHKRKQPVAKTPVVSEPVNGWILAEESTALWRTNLLTGSVLVLLPLLGLYVGITVIGTNPGLTWRLTVGVAILAVSMLWLIINSAPVIYFQLKAAQGKRPKIAESYGRGLRLLPRLVGLNALVAFLVFIGLFMLLVPGFIFFRRYFLASYYMVDHNLGVRESMARSARDSKPNAPYIWGVAALAFIIFPALSSLLSKIWPPYGGVLTVIAGVLYTFAPALRYLEISKISQSRSLMVQQVAAVDKK